VRLTCAGEPHLTYCTNIHSGESWSEIRANLETYVTRVKRRVSPDRPFGVGLRLSGQAAAELSAPGVLPGFRGWLDDQGLYVFTINGFPYGTFHRARVKEEVYLPDWLDDERLAYTNRLAELLTELVPSGVEGTVSTVPGAFKPRIHGPSDVEAIADRMLRHAAVLARLRDRTGKSIALALEPEPFCQLETIAESVSFFEDHLFSTRGLSRFAEWSGVASGRAEEALRQHLGLCFDACHMAVEFEDLDPALARIDASAIRIAKIQVSAGLEVANPSLPGKAAPVRGGAASELLDELGRFAEGVYLHQVTEQSAIPGSVGELRRWVDLPEAIAAATARGGLDGPWRIHFHVPLFREELGRFRSTQPYLAQLLARARDTAIAPHLEVETYTWDVLPEEHRQVPVVDAVARELEWVMGELALSSSRATP
jgi:hypothetical protein